MLWLGSRSPLFPQTELVEYCRQEGIVLQAYASLGGQDTGIKGWTALLGKPQGAPVAAPVSKAGKQQTKKQRTDAVKLNLLNSPAVMELARELTTTTHNLITPAQVLLRWGLEHEVVLIPKTTSQDRLLENAGVFHFSMTPQQVMELRDTLLATVQRHNPDCENVQTLTRLCWRNDPLRLMDFD